MVLNKSVYATHTERAASQSNRELAEHIVFLTICECKPLDQLTPGQGLLRDELLKHMIGSWVASNIKYACHLPDCAGGAACTKHARAHVLGMFYRASLGRGIQIPVASRWWKSKSDCSPGLVRGRVSQHLAESSAYPHRQRMAGPRHMAPGAFLESPGELHVLVQSRHS